MYLFYDPNIRPKDLFYTLNEKESKHVIRVLRMNVGDDIGILDGKGNLYTCEIISDNRKRCDLKVKSVKIKKLPANEIHIALSPPKKMERIEWFIEKATEIGITEISLLECENSERIKIKVERLINKAISAMKQSQRKFLPKINMIIKVNDFIKNNPNGIIAHCHKQKRENFNTIFSPKKCPILIGPEGDFTLKEIEFAKENGYKTLTLGENRLRTETAALYTCIQAKISMQ